MNLYRIGAQSEVSLEDYFEWYPFHDLVERETMLAVLDQLRSIPIDIDVCTVTSHQVLQVVPAEDLIFPCVAIKPEHDRVRVEGANSPGSTLAREEVGQAVLIAMRQCGAWEVSPGPADDNPAG